MQAVPIHIKEANACIAKYHRHSLPTVGAKFAVGAVHHGKLVGVAVAGRPVARRLDDGKTIEVLRVCTDGTPNCCSFQYARVAMIAQLFGYTRSSPTPSKKRAGPACGRWGEGRRPGRSAGVEHPEPIQEKPGRLPKEEGEVGTLSGKSPGPAVWLTTSAVLDWSQFHGG